MFKAHSRQAPFATRYLARVLLAACVLVISVVESVSAATLVIAEHRSARLQALYSQKASIEASLGVQLKIVEYPAPAKDYFTKLVTELRAGNAPDVFTIPRDLQLDDLAAAGYLLSLEKSVSNWSGYPQLPELVKQLARASFDGQTYAIPSIVAVEQLYYRHDLLEALGVSTEQPQTLDNLIERAREIKQKTGAYALLFPAGLTWGIGSYTEGLRYLIAADSEFSLLDSGNRYDLNNTTLENAFAFYERLIKEQLMPVQPLLNPEPWVIPKYEMFPTGKLLITTCGTWCRVFDWGPDSRNPIENVNNNVRTWKIPSVQGGEPFVLASMVYSWAVNAKTRQPELAKQLALAMGGVDVAIAYSKKLGNVPARLDAKNAEDFASLGVLADAHALLNEAKAVRTTVGANAMMAGVSKATEALLTGRADSKKASKILHNYVSSVLGEKWVVNQ